MSTFAVGGRSAQQSYGSQPARRKNIMSLIANFAARVGLRDRRRNARMPTRGLEATYLSGGKQKLAAIRDISPTGICLSTAERIAPGAVMQVTLRRPAMENDDCGTQVLLRARVVRAKERDLGLEFVHEHIDAAGWSELVLKAAELSPHHDGIRIFRLARALAFLKRISPAAESQFLKTITGGMSYDGAERALEIILEAEELLAAQGQTAKSGVDARMIRRILDQGTNLDTSNAELVRCWAGLLAVAAQKGADDLESVRFADLLSGLEVAPIRILYAAGAKAMAMGWDSGYAFPRKIECSPEELRKLAGIGAKAGVEWALCRLHEMGLLQAKLRPPTYEPVPQLDITPSGLGLKLWARCNGRLGVPEACSADGEKAN